MQHFKRNVDIYSFFIYSTHPKTNSHSKRLITRVVAKIERYIDIGLSSKGRLAVVSYIERGEKIRIISSREATTKEQGEYENK